MSRLTYLAGLVALLLVGCSGATDGAGSASPTTPSASVASRATSPASTASEPSSEAPVTIQSECETQAPFVETRLKSGDGSIDVPVATLGKGSTVVILMHQTRPIGSMCGWVPFAEEFASQGVKVVMFDFCGFGRSDCDSAKFYLRDQVALVTDWARKQGAKRVVLAGVSLGGTAAVTSAKQVRADAVISVSGAPAWGASELANDLPTLTMPTMFVYAEQDASIRDDIRKQWAKIPTRTKVMLPGERNGHGWEIIAADTSAKMLAWIKGDHAAVPPR